MPHVVHIDRSRSWLPPAIRQATGQLRLTIVFSEPERKVFRKRKKIPVSRWAERYRHVTMGPLPGPWRNGVTPYLAGIMDASWYPTVQAIIMCKSPQSGGTEAILNCLGYVIDRDPGSVLAIYPDEITGKENMADRILPMIQQSPRLRSYMTGVDDDASALRIKLHHMFIYIAWARSASRLANKPIRYLLFDETDKYVETAGKRETDPISLGEARTITYRFNRKVWKVSTPTTETGNIWKALTTEAQLVFDYWVRCPSCDADQKMEFKNIKWPRAAEPGPDGKIHSEDPAVIESEKLAVYECPHCLAQWNDYERDAAVRAGGWRDRASGLKLFEALRARRPMKIGFHLPSWISPFVSLSEIAASFLSSRGNRIKDRDFHNKHLAEPWTNLVTTTDREKILAAKCPLSAQTVPEEAVALTVGVDVQKAGFWFVVRAWSREGRSWLVHYGFLATWEEVETLIFATSYPVGDTGRSMRPFRALIDTGGGSKYEDMTMTEETYLWIIRNRGRGGVALWGSKGASTPMPTMLKMGGEILHTSSGKKLPAAFKPIFIDTVKAKDQFHERLQKAADPETRALPDAAFLHAGTGDDYVAQIMAEEKKLNEKGREEWVNVGHRANHLLDAEILAAACVEMEFPGGGLRLRAEQLKALEARRQAVAKAPATTETRETVGGYQRPGWLNR